MTVLTSILLLLAYISLLIELVFFPVPSVASTYQLSYQAQASATGAEMKGALQKVRSWSLLKKVFLLVLPAMINIATFVLPLVFLWRPALLDKCWPVFQPANLFTYLGLILVVIGRLITFGSVLKIRKNNSQLGEDFQLHENSFFSLSRNPGLIGMYLMIAGLCLIFPSLYLMVGLVFYIGYMHFKILLEEDFLANQFGQSYLNYQSKTKRYL